MSKDKPLPEGFVLDESIKQAILVNLKDGHLSCAKAHAIAKQSGTSPQVIGHSVDAMDIRLTRCQIGLFGYPNKKGWIEAGVKDLPVADSFVAALNAKAGANKCISCIELWDLAGAHKISRMQAGYLADKLGLQIMDCQLGAF